MDKDTYRGRILDELKKLDAADVEKCASEQPGMELFLDAYDRWMHARAAFGPMAYEEFIEIARRKRKPGRPSIDPGDRAEKPIYRAAHDVARIRSLWRTIAPDAKAPPVPHLEIAAQRNNVDEAKLGELVRRPRARRNGGLAAADK